MLYQPYLYRGGGGGGRIYESRNRSTQSFISVDMRWDVNRLRNSELVVKQIYNFSWQNVSSKVRNAGKLIPFAFKTVRVNMLLKMRKRKVQLAFS